MAREQFDLAMQHRAGRDTANRARARTSSARWTTISRTRCRRRSGCRSPWTGRSDPHSVLIRVQLPDGVLDVEAPRKRLYTGDDLSVRAVAGRHRAAAVRHRRPVHAQPGAGDPPAGRGGGGVRHGPRRRRRSGRRAPPRSARPRPPSTACRTHPPLPGAADRDAGRRVARPAHAADPAAAGAGDAAARPRNCGRTSPT